MPCDGESSKPSAQAISVMGSGSQATNNNNNQQNNTSDSTSVLRKVRCTEEDLQQKTDNIFREVETPSDDDKMQVAALKVLNHVVTEMSNRNNVPPLHYSIVTDIGQGTFGTISLCQRNDDIDATVGQYWAQRLVLKTSVKDRSQYDKEKHVLFLLREAPPFVTRCFGCFQSGDLDIIALPFYAGGDMYTHLSSRWPLPSKDIALYTGEIATALHFMHQHDIIYLDLKAENVLLSHEGHIRLVDFGISVVMNDSHFTPVGRKELVTEAGTLPYCAPEILKRVPHAFESDWWSLGILLYEMVVGYTPFLTSDNPQDICQSICSLPFEVPEDIYDDNQVEFDLIGKLLKKDQVLRLGYEMTDFEEKFQQHPLFSKYEIDWNLLGQEEITPEWTPSLDNIIDTRYFQY